MKLKDLFLAVKMCFLNAFEAAAGSKVNTTSRSK